MHIIPEAIEGFQQSDLPVMFVGAFLMGAYLFMIFIDTMMGEHSHDVNDKINHYEELDDINEHNHHIDNHNHGNTNLNNIKHDDSIKLLNPNNKIQRSINLTNSILKNSLILKTYNKKE